MVNLVSSSVEPLTQIVDPAPSSLNPNIHLKSETKVTNPVLSSIIPTLHLKSVKVFVQVPSPIDPTPPLKSATHVVDLVPSPVNSTPPLKSVTKVVNLVLSPVDPTPHSKSEDVAQVYLVKIDSPRQGGTSPVPMAPPSSNQMISINWNNLTENRLPSYIPFQIIVQVCDRNIPNTVIDEGDFVSILSVNSWQAFGSP
jgi:hypothetical protein